MKLLTVIIGLFWASSLYADCTGAGLSVFPSGQSIKQNSIFIINGYAESQNVILKLNNKYSIYLKSGNYRIKLSVLEIHVGQFYLTQALLRPDTELKAGIEYTMYIDSLPVFERLGRYNSSTGKYDPITYTVISERDNEKPLVTAKPKEINKTLYHFGCGPEIHVVFNNTAKDKSDLVVKTTVKNLKTGKETTFYIEPVGDKINVGHEMCSGAFDFDDNNYEVEFQFMDACGNITTWTGPRIKFTKPVKVTNR